MLTPCEAAPAQASSPAATEIAAAPPRRQQEPPAEPAAAADRQREQRLELLVGLLVPCGADLRAREQADGQDEEDEHEGEVAGGRHDRAGAELGQLALHALGDPGG